MSEAVASGRGLVAAILGASEEVVSEKRREASTLGIVAPANFNCPGQIVIAGEKAAVERAIELMKSKGCRKAIPLPVSVPVHTPLMQVAADRLAHDVAAATWFDVTAPLVNNAEAKPLRRADEIKASVIRQLPSPVLWEKSVKELSGANTFIEVGTRTVLTGLIKRIIPEANIFNVHDPKSLETTVAGLKEL